MRQVGRRVLDFVAARDAMASIASDQVTTSPGQALSASTGELQPTFNPALVQLFPFGRELGWRVCTLRKRAEVGRASSADLLVDHPTVSRHHAEVVASEQGVHVSDKGSTQGSYVEGVRVGESGVLAGFGQIVRFGETIWLVVRDGGPYQTPPRRLAASYLDLPGDMVAGPTLGRVWDQTVRVASLTAPVLVLGESGSGKEAIARLLHASRPNKGPFVALNVAAVPSTLFESVLFGHEKGAFTGASAAQPGAFREASGGVLFLDEVADLGLDLQAKLLRAIDLKQIRPVGARSDVKVDLRLVSATSGNLKALCATGAFRKDLYYRLAGLIVSVPPLRERRDEILLLARSILAEVAPEVTLSPSGAEALLLHRWDGNVRNLRYAVMHAAGQATTGGRQEIHQRDLPPLRPVTQTDAPVTRSQLRAAMKASKGVATRAATALGVSRATFYRLCARLGIDTDTLRPR